MANEVDREMSIECRYKSNGNLRYELSIIGGSKAFLYPSLADDLTGVMDAYNLLERMTKQAGHIGCQLIRVSGEDMQRVVVREWRKK